MAHQPLGGSIRTRLGADVDPLTSLYADSKVKTVKSWGSWRHAPKLPFTGLTILEVWYLISGADENGEVVEGWSPSRLYSGV